jgi:hypothetical protein
LLSAGRGHEDVSDFLGVVAVLAFEADDEVKLLFALHHLRGHVAADGGGDQGVDVGDVHAVTGDHGAVDFDVEAGLAEFLHQRHIRMPRTCSRIF